MSADPAALNASLLKPLPFHTHTHSPQARNYVTRKEQERKRRELFDDALDKFKAGDIPVGGWAELRMGQKRGRRPSGFGKASGALTAAGWRVAQADRLLQTASSHPCNPFLNPHPPPKPNHPQSALVDFENVASLEPRNYVGDSGARITPILPVTQYNIACCYSSLGQVGRGWVGGWVVVGGSSNRLEPHCRLPPHLGRP
jgi:hypothetical protein